jgi:excisionase family DNA binding protein
MKELILVDKEELRQIILETLGTHNQKSDISAAEIKNNFIDSFEVAKMTSTHIMTVRRWAKEGSIRGYKIDRKLLFDSSEVNEFIRKKQIQPRKFKEA